MPLKPPAKTAFRCPGESYPIDRPTHLARLASGYAPCRSCADRQETGGLLPAATPSSTDEVCHSSGLADAIWTSEGLAGTAENQIDAAVARRLGMALGTVLAQLPGAGKPVRVAVGGDGRWLTAPLVAGVSLGCQRAGCRVIEIGNATAGSMEMAIRDSGLDGGILIGNAVGAAQMVGLKCWGADARPFSAGGGLEAVRRAAAGEAVRTSRRFGGLERVDLTAAYRQQLGELFHGLRPLRFVLDAASRPLVEHLRVLVGRSACEIISPGVPDSELLAELVPAGSPRPSRIGAQAVRPGALARRAESARTRPDSPRSRAIDRLRTRIARVEADFGLWIDGDGDELVLVDQRGRQIGPARLLGALRREAAPTDRRPIVLAAGFAPCDRQPFEADGPVIEAEPTREAVDAAMRASGAVAAAGPGDRLWFAG
ncbi:MAG TPA: hypothetical protein VGG30_06810, partial [Pirellulales bacterium]